MKEFKEIAAIFGESNTVETIDVVILTTWYTFSFPFFEDSVNIIDDQISPYHCIFPLHLENPTLAFIGLSQPVGMVIPAMEAGSLWGTCLKVRELWWNE